jgi:hypothetical protein
MNKDYKIMAALIPIILILCFALYGETGIIGFASSNSNLNASFSEFSKFMDPFTALALQGKQYNNTIVDSTNPKSVTTTSNPSNSQSTSSQTDNADQTPSDTSTDTDETPTDNPSQTDDTPTDSNPTME